MEISSELGKVMTELSLRKKIVIKQLSFCPKCDLMRSFNNGKPAVFEVTRNDAGKRIRKTITKDRGRQLAIAKKAALTVELERLQGIEQALNDILETAEEIGEIGMQHFLLRNYDWFSRAEIDAICFENAITDEWAAAEYEQSDYRSEQRRIVTTSGIYVRSKSEALIVETLQKYQIPFRYEQPLYVGNTSLIPDFTIKRSDGKLFYWEHEGLTGNRQYLEHQRWKEEIYASVGIVPWDNLIVTYDCSDGCIDLRIVEAEICSKLLI